MNDIFDELGMLFRWFGIFERDSFRNIIVVAVPFVEFVFS